MMRGAWGVVRGAFRSVRLQSQQTFSLHKIGRAAESAAKSLSGCEGRHRFRTYGTRIRAEQTVCRAANCDPGIAISSARGQSASGADRRDATIALSDQRAHGLHGAGTQLVGGTQTLPGWLAELFTRDHFAVG